jgi:enoyl-CoA hydratase
MTLSADKQSTDVVSVSRGAGVATVIVANPPVNAMSEAVLGGLAAAFHELAEDREVRAVVLSGDGDRAFLAGAEIDELRAMVAAPPLVREHVGLSGQLFSEIAALPQPLVAAANASAVGGGFEMLLACDFAVVDEGARVGFPELRLGLIPGAGGTQRLARSVGVTRALRMVLTHELITAEEAARIGLVAEVAPRGEALPRAQRLAARLAALPAGAVQSAKRVIREGAELPIAQALDREREAFVALFQTEDVREGVDAFLEKRTPSFEHR